MHGVLCSNESSNLGIPLKETRSQERSKGRRIKEKCQQALSRCKEENGEPRIVCVRSKKSGQGLYSMVYLNVMLILVGRNIQCD